MIVGCWLYFPFLGKDSWWGVFTIALNGYWHCGFFSFFFIFFADI